MRQLRIWVCPLLLVGAIWLLKPFLTPTTEPSYAAPPPAAAIQFTAGSARQWLRANPDDLDEMVMQRTSVASPIPHASLGDLNRSR